MKKIVIIGVICLFVGMGFQPAFANIMENNPPNVPSNPIPENGAVGVPNYVNLSWTGGDPDGDFVVYDIYFDDVNPPITKRASKQPDDYWEIPFYLPDCHTYYWRIVAYDSEFFTEGPVWSFTTNCFPPSDPIIDGPCSGKINQLYNFTFLSTDPYNFIIYYYVKWGDGTEEISDFYANGTPATLSHSWNTIGDKYIRAKAINGDGQESGWSTWTITIPRIKQEDCDCQTVVNNLDINVLEKLNGINDVFNKILTLQKMDFENESICFFIAFRLLMIIGWAFMCYDAMNYYYEAGNFLVYKFYAFLFDRASERFYRFVDFGVYFECWPDPWDTLGLKLIFKSKTEFKNNIFFMVNS